MLVALLGGLVAVGAVSPAQRPRGAPGRRSRTAPATGRRTSASTTRGTGWSARRDSARAHRGDDGRARSSGATRAARGVRVRLDPDGDQLDQAAEHVDLRPARRLHRDASGRTQKRCDYCSHLKTESDDPLRPRRVHRQSITRPRGRAPTTTAVRPDRAVLRRPAALRAQPQPDRDLRRPARPSNDSIHCDSQFCGTQLVGTGAAHGRRPHRQQVHASSTRIRADRAGGVYLRNFTVQQAEFNAVYVLETDGFVLDRRDRARQRRVRHPRLRHRPRADPAHRTPTTTATPASTPARAPTSTPTTRSFEADPLRHRDPQQPQPRQHARLLRHGGQLDLRPPQRVLRQRHRHRHGLAVPRPPGPPAGPRAVEPQPDLLATTRTTTPKYVDTGVCAKPMEERGYIDGTVCPVVPTPVGTGVLIAGGNFNSTDHNWIYDNWRYGTMQFWVPAPLRDEFDPAKLYDTSHHNHTFANLMGFTPDGTIAHNGMDHWWDDEGDGNCWEDNTSSRGEPTDNFTVDPAALRRRRLGVHARGCRSRTPGFLSCSQYDRNDPTCATRRSATGSTARRSRPTSAAPARSRCRPRRRRRAGADARRARPADLRARRRSPSAAWPSAAPRRDPGPLTTRCAAAPARPARSPSSWWRAGPAWPSRRRRRRPARGRTDPGRRHRGDRGLRDRRPHDPPGPLPRPGRRSSTRSAAQRRQPAGHRGRARAAGARAPAVPLPRRRRRLRRARGSRVPAGGTGEVRAAAADGRPASRCRPAPAASSTEVALRTTRAGASSTRW